MNEVVLSILVFLPVIMAAGACAFAWRRLNRPLLFLVVATLALLGLQGLVAPVAVGIFWPFASGISRAAANESFVRSLQLSATIVLVAGIPLLWWLSRAFMRN